MGELRKMDNERRIMKLCSRCEQALRRRKILRRVNVRPEEKVDCEICFGYSSGGYYEVESTRKPQTKGT